MPLKPSIDTSRLRTSFRWNQLASRNAVWFARFTSSSISYPCVGAPKHMRAYRIFFQLGWMAWKDREALLFALVVCVFGCSRGEMNFFESLTEFGLELEVPNDQVRFGNVGGRHSILIRFGIKKELKGKFWLKSIKSISISPSMRAPDCKVVRAPNLESLGSEVLSDSVKSNIEGKNFANMGPFKNSGPF
ncbi:hypothetical protein BC830DRAFT_1152508 [Chytriomyces sp. MP71]|nr:hypothetical protein BC830DRAFT_1152508 [Chytriomyces sp. MP71]